MQTLDVITVIVAIVLALLGLLFGFGKTLRFFTKGIFGVVISVFVCATFGGMIAGISAVAEWIGALNTKLGQSWSFLETIHLATVIYYVVLFFAVQIVRIIIVKCVAGVFEVDVLPMRIVNKLLGMALAVAAVLLLTLLVFAVFRTMQDTSFVQNILSKINGTFLGSLYENNPVKFVVDNGSAEEASLLLSCIVLC